MVETVAKETDDEEVSRLVEEWKKPRRVRRWREAVVAPLGLGVVG